MKILHTADWHIGQLFHEYDRHTEHQAFLNWLRTCLSEQDVDVLLISGDIFDSSNPSAHSIKLFYEFLSQTARDLPQLQIIITAGNHDSAARLEAPKPLLSTMNIKVVGLIHKTEAGQIDYGQLCLPLKNKAQETVAWCLAIPFLRMGDYPVPENAQNPYAEGVSLFYQEAFAWANAQKTEGQAIIAMGHLHAQQAEISDMDKAERLIMGGVESLSASAFHPDLAYVALGHIHKAQRIGGLDHVRYSGSPLPMSFSERNYKHQVLVFELNGEKAENIHSLEIPVSIPVISMPIQHAPMPEVLKALEALPAATDLSQAPYLEVRVLEDQPDPARRYQIEQVLQGKQARLASINLKSIKAKNQDETHWEEDKSLDELTPKDIFEQNYRHKYQTEVPQHLVALFEKSWQEALQAP
jgi:DNA repair protein SbcD/Mre11